MAASQQLQQDKDQFFAELDRLGESDDEIWDEIGAQTQSQTRSGSRSKSQPQPPRQAPPEPQQQSDDDDVKIVKVVKVAVDAPAIVDKVDDNKDRDRKTLRRAETPPRTKNAVAKTRPKTEVVSKPVSARTQTKHVAETKPKRPRKTRNKDEIDLLPDDQRLFDGFVFCKKPQSLPSVVLTRIDFIPNNDVAKPRKTRIRTSISHGATWVRSYGPTVTHVIVDYHLDIHAASKALPENWSQGSTIFVRDIWLIETLKYKELEDHLQSRFRVRGLQMSDEQIKQRQATNSTSKALPSSSSKRRFEELEPSTHDNTNNNDHDELSLIMKQMDNQEQLVSPRFVHKAWL